MGSSWGPLCRGGFGGFLNLIQFNFAGNRWRVGGISEASRGSSLQGAFSISRCRISVHFLCSLQEEAFNNSKLMLNGFVRTPPEENWDYATVYRFGLVKNEKWTNLENFPLIFISRGRRVSFASGTLADSKITRKYLRAPESRKLPGGEKTFTVQFAKWKVFRLTKSSRSSFLLPPTTCPQTFDITIILLPFRHVLILEHQIPLWGASCSLIWAVNDESFVASTAEDIIVNLVRLE